MILSDRELGEYIKNGILVVKPLNKETVRENGLDLRLGENFAKIKSLRETLNIKGKVNVEDYYEVRKAKSFILKPNERVLVTTLEYIEVPLNLVGFINLRSTFARLGLILPPTIVDGGFKGSLTVGLVGGSFPVKLYAGERFLHLVFAKLTSPVKKPYKGKYQGQRGVTLPRFDF
ncbi:MAG: dCTP deaminase [Candidatus Bathyarchaeota archaeon]|nr:dCTP deaminase [Candidatus Bathyarchaeota archaeon]